MSLLAYSYLDSPYYYSRAYDYPYYSRYYSSYYPSSSLYDYPSWRYRSAYDPVYTPSYAYRSYLDYPYYSRYYDYPYYSRYSSYYPYSSRYYVPPTSSVSYETVKRETVYSPYVGARTYTTVL